jgi:hypothetical protein
MLKESEVPEGMVGNAPWGQPLKRWTPAMLQRGLDACDDSPALAGAIREELRSR